jgi:signal recognition particle subunit SRP68
MAQTLVDTKRWRDAIALLHRAEEYLDNSLKLNPPSELASQLLALKMDIEGQKFSVHSNSVLSDDEQAETCLKKYVKQEKVRFIVMNNRNKLWISKHQPLAVRLQEYCEDFSLTSRQPSVYSLPPDFEPIPCKPLFFDLAFNQVEFPTLEDKLEQKQFQTVGITGFVKGLWGWGTADKK